MNYPLTRDLYQGAAGGAGVAIGKDPGPDAPRPAPEGRS